jgi:acetaldehyde dehydrogenase (acetylating)
MPAMRVLCNTPTPQGSVGITTNLFPAMTLGCGAVAGNSTGDNVSPLNLINIKRLAYAVRKPEDAFEMPKMTVPVKVAPQQLDSANVDKPMVMAAVERYLAQRGVPVFPQASTPKKADVVSDVVDRFLAAKRTPPPAVPVPAAAPVIEQKPPAPPSVIIVDFVCENDVQTAILKSQKIYIGPKTIVTPSARDLAAPHDTLVHAKRT